ncbi:hypothetical protein JOF29_000541 [Kribbella aluminosa]|uniref:Nucleotidyltransferase-like protein n=1 Tax=Kribbella aluminosa TaxID=416017 RepID=A0ABS4UCV6_9ACTN|nr:nucleotidyltransferase domain-containing protein [Kribbella aluminosa]MBP2349458.1 hypothetical protein [Kribbella aluminosa]
MTLPVAVAELTERFLAEVDSRLPERLTGLFLHGSICWGEFFPGSDVDFVAVWDDVPAGSDLKLLQEAHETAKAELTFDGFHCTAADLATHPSALSPRPVFFQGAFNPEGTSDINLVTWHELAERPVVVHGELPPVYTNLDDLIAFTRTNLDTYWRAIARRIELADLATAGQNDAAVAWVTLGAPRLHHLLTTRTLTSKSGAGRYVLNSLDPRWHQLAEEALAIRETPGTPTTYNTPTERAQDTHALLTWILQDATGH